MERSTHNHNTTDNLQNQEEKVSKAKIKTGALKNIDEPYSHLAASIILQAYDDLRCLDGRDSGYIDGYHVNKWEVINFFHSNWCGVLLSFQDAVTQDDVRDAVMTLA